MGNQHDRQPMAMIERIRRTDALFHLAVTA